MNDGPVARLRRALPDAELAASWTVARRRAREWSWPALQMGIAAAAAWWLARAVVGDAASYAPITAIVGLGLGRERRLGRSALLTGGLLLGVVAGEPATTAVGMGWWQIGMLMTVAAVVSGALMGHDLAVTYATINAVVLLTTPGADGWFPSRLAAGLVGVGVAVAVMLVVVPARPVTLVRTRLSGAAERASTAVRETAESLADGLADDDPTGDDRPLIALARRLDDAIEESHSTVDQANELVRWSPWRRRDRREVQRLGRLADELRPALRTASTIARLGDRAALLGVTAPVPIRDALCRAGAELRSLTDALLGDSAPDDDDMEVLSKVVDRLLEAEVEHAVLVAIQEEVRGVLSDLDDIVERVVDDPPTAPSRLRTARVGSVTYGR